MTRLPTPLAVATIVLLLASVGIHSMSGFYDDDEVGHYVSLKSMNKGMWFSPWQRAGFKVLYLPIENAPLNVIRGVNLLMVAACCLILFRISGVLVPVIFLTFPFVQQIGARFYAEIPAMLILLLSVYFLRRRRLTLFALALSYGALVRFELGLLFLPAIYILRHHPRHIPYLFAFPLLYYLVSVAATGGDLSYLFKSYFGYAQELPPLKGADPFHYLRELISMSGFWALLAFPAVLLALRHEEDHERFMAVSTVLLVLFLSISYWEKTGFGPIAGVPRHILLTAPMVAFFARAPVDKLANRYKVALVVLALVIVATLPLLRTNAEYRLIETACERVERLTYSRLYVQHPAANYYLGKPLHGPDVTTVDDLDVADDNALLLWENHYAGRRIKFAEVDSEWTQVWRGRAGGFRVFLMRKSPEPGEGD